MITQLGRQRLAGVPGRALRLAPAALGAGGEVEHALPGEVLDLAAAEDVVLARVLEVDRLAAGLHRQQRAEAERLALGRHVDRRQRDVQVLGVRHDDQEAMITTIWPSTKIGLDRPRWRCARAARAPCAVSLRRERPPAVAEREDPGVDLRAAVEQQRQDDQEDHAEDLPGRAGVRAVEARRPLDPGRVLPAAQDRERDQAGQHGDREEVLEEADHAPACRSAGCGSPCRTARRTPRGSSAPRMRKPQKVNACARPGTDQRSSRRWPMTSPSCGPQPLADAVEPARWPAGRTQISRYSHHTRRPAIANAITVAPRPMTRRSTMGDPPFD